MNVRVRFEKKDRMQFLGHLELINAFEQIFRRARVPLLYTKGYNPRVDMNFALPLGVGIETEYGLFDVKIRDGFDIELLKCMPWMPQGLRVLDVKETTDKPLMTVVHSADYLIRGEVTALFEALSQDQLIYQKKTKKGLKAVDAKPLILFSQMTPEGLLVRLRAGSEANLKATDLLQFAAETPEVRATFDILQKTLYDSSGHELWKR